MKRIYNQPEVQVAQYASMTLMQAASGGGSTQENMGMNDIPGEQW